MKVDDILADKVIQLSAVSRLPPTIKILTLAPAVVLAAGYVTYGRIQPDIKIFTRVAGNLKTKVGRVTTDVPVLQPRVYPLPKFISNRRLQMFALGPLCQQLLKMRQVEEQMGRCPVFRCGPGEGRHRVDQVGRTVGRTAGLAIVTVLIRCFTARAGPLDEAVGEEKTFLGVKGLDYFALADVAAGLEAGEYLP